MLGGSRGQQSVVNGQLKVDFALFCLFCHCKAGGQPAEGSSQWAVDSRLFCTLHWSAIVQGTMPLCSVEGNAVGQQWAVDIEQNSGQLTL